MGREGVGVSTTSTPLYAASWPAAAVHSAGVHDVTTLMYAMATLCGGGRDHAVGHQLQPVRHDCSPVTADKG